MKNQLGLSWIFVLWCGLVVALTAADNDDVGEKFKEASDANRRFDGRYIVLLNNATSEGDVVTIRDRILNSSNFRQDLSLVKTFKALKAFTLEVRDDGTAVNNLATVRERRRFKLQSILEAVEVDLVEEVQVYRTTQEEVTHQTCATWGLDRIDQAERTLNNVYSHVFDGSGVTAYILDTGVRETHEDFSGRASCGYNAFADLPRGQQEDCFDYSGHGTHVMGTIGGAKYGVAKNVKLVAVKVLGSDGSGATDGIVDAIEWVINQAASSDGPSVANLSLGGSFSEALNRAVASGVSQGLFMSVAAGNEDQNACLVSPASTIVAMTVGASTRLDARASFSNFGPCVNIFAPGQEIVSASHCSDTEVESFSGTSMAAPHVAGVAALYFQKYPQESAVAIKRRMLDDATQDVIKLPNGSPTRLLSTVALNDGVESSEPPVVDQCPTPNLSSGCSPEPDDKLSWFVILIIVLGSLVVCAFVAPRARNYVSDARLGKEGDDEEAVAAKEESREE